MTNLRRQLRRAWRRIMFKCLQGLIFLAALAGPGGVRRLGTMLGELHYRTSGRQRRRLTADIARALERDPGEAGAILRESYRVNDRAVTELVAMASPALDPRRLVDTVRVDGSDHLRGPDGTPRPAVLLGMHMGNGVLMAARLAAAGLPVHVVHRDPRRLPPGLLVRSFDRVGLGALEIHRSNPTRSFRAMLEVLKSGDLVYVLMDQGNKAGGLPVEFLGKPMYLPIGVIRLARRAAVPMYPVTTLGATPDWHFRIDPALELPADASDEDMVGHLSDAMCERIRTRPELWAWHHRRWRRYDFA